MTTQTAALGEFENPRLPTQAKLAAAWTSFMFLYVYVDVLGLYKPGFVEGILKGRVWERGVSEKMHQFAEVIPDQDAVVIADPA